ncbi:hypothetical protein L7F22_058429 [Adiantum nelumboides]|nr:hypothetical protein [Adiantum nelumboides]
MATFIAFLKGRNFLIMQLALYLWYGVRKAAVLRLPWAIAISALFTRKVWFQSRYYVLEKRGQPLKVSGDVEMKEVEGRWYCVAREKLEMVDKLVSLHRNQSFIFSEYLRSGLPWAVARRCSIHDAMCKIMQGHCIVEYNSLEKFVIERFPLREDDWKSKVLQGVPVALSALKAPLASSVATFSLYALDLIYYVWLDAFMLLARAMKRLLHFMTCCLPFGAKYMLYLPLSWVWPEFMPSNPYTLTVEYRSLDSFYIKEGFWTDQNDFNIHDLDVRSCYPTQEQSTRVTKSKCFDCSFEVRRIIDASHIELLCTFKRIACNFGKVKFSVNLCDYFKIMTLLEECMNSSMNLVRCLKVDETGSLNLHCFDHIDLMQMVLEPFCVKKLTLKERIHVLVG